jgi:hypothetical protein
MSNPTGIDTTAPVVARHDIDIDARLSTIWRLQTDVNNWPQWQTDVTYAHSEKGFEPGNSFTWTSFGFTVTSTIYDVVEGSRSLWGGTAEGITGVHEWMFCETPAGAQVVTNESFAGDPVAADPAGMQSILDGSLSSWLHHLKVAAESST